MGSMGPHGTSWASRLKLGARAQARPGAQGPGLYAQLNKKTGTFFFGKHVNLNETSLFVGGH